MPLPAAARTGAAPAGRDLSFACSSLICIWALTCHLCLLDRAPVLLTAKRDPRACARQWPMVTLYTSKAALLHIAALHMCHSCVWQGQTHVGHASDTLRQVPTCCSFMNITMSIATYACICKELRIQMR